MPNIGPPIIGEEAPDPSGIALIHHIKRKECDNALLCTLHFQAPRLWEAARHCSKDHCEEHFTLWL